MRLKTPIRYSKDRTGMEIDQNKRQWPFFRIELLRDAKRVGIYIDCNEGGQVVGEGKGIASVRISLKKARALRDFLCDLDLDG